MSQVYTEQVESRKDQDATYEDGCQTDLYRYFDKDGELLYVGVSLNSIARAAQHRTQSCWYDDFHTMTRQSYSTRGEALDAETLAIVNEQPKHNVRKTTPPRPKSKSRAQREYEQLEYSILYKPMYNTTEAASALGVSTSRIRTWQKDGKLGFIYIGNRPMVTGWQIIDFLEWAGKRNAVEN